MSASSPAASAPAFSFRGAVHVNDAARLTAAERRERFLAAGLFRDGGVSLLYWETDRTIIGGAVPLAAPLKLEAFAELRAASFLERRELGIINLGGAGRVSSGGQEWRLGNRDGVYLGRGAADPVFTSEDPANPARFYLVSYLAHRACPAAVVRHADVVPDELGAPATANRRRLFKYFAPGRVETCQLTMGMTFMETGSIWNTMPPHTHTRRSEVYCYFDLSPNDVVFHLMGPADNTSHVVMRAYEAVLSPPWSIHAGAGTAAYGFVWCMGGENQEFSDMDKLTFAQLS